MPFTVMSWNIEGFLGEEDPSADAIEAFITDQTADVIAIYEVRSSHQAFLFAQSRFSGFFTFITEGQNNQEVMLLINPTNFDHVTVTQQHKFRVGNPFLRPGALATVTQGGVHTNILFLHSASGIKADQFGDRSEISEHFFDLNKRLQQIEDDGGPNARLIITGDLNTMGMRFPRNIVANQVQTGVEELAGLGVLAGRAHRDNFNGMRIAPKEHDLTFSNRNDRQQSDLDHVLVSDGLLLANRGQRADGNLFEVAVDGWVQRNTQPLRNEFIDNLSDHCALVFTVQ